MNDFDFNIFHLKELKNGFELLLDFNKKIKIYSTESEMVKTIKKFLEHGNPIGVIYKGKLIAYFNLYCNNLDSLESYFGNLYVLKDFRRHGIAKKLVVEAINYAKSMRFRSVVLHVSENNIAAKKLYEGIGFKYTGERKLLGSENCDKMIFELGE